MECLKRVGKGAITYSCDVPIPDGHRDHRGPCRAIELSYTVSQRAKWEAEGEEARRVLAATQSQPRTFAEANKGHSPTPVPGSDLMPKEYRQTPVLDHGEEPQPPLFDPTEFEVSEKQNTPLVSQSDIDAMVGHVRGIGDCIYDRGEFRELMNLHVYPLLDWFDSLRKRQDNTDSNS